MHPIDIAAQRVDLAVMRDVAVGVGAIPAWKGVGAETRVHEGQRRFHRWILQVEKIPRELLGQQHAFVNNGLVRQAGQVPKLAAVNGRGANLAVGPLADDVEFALERPDVGQGGVPADKNLADEWLGGLGGCAKRGVIGRHGAPTEHDLSFRLDNLPKEFFQPAPHSGLLREENEAAAILARAGQSDPGFLARLLEKTMWHLQQHAGAVARVWLAAAGSTVIEIV